MLNSKREATVWERYCGQSGQLWPCAIHVDTGMNGLGMTIEEAVSFAEDAMLTRSLDIVLVMSQLACADMAGHPKNAAQFESFQAVRTVFEGVESSLANSAGLFLGRNYHLDLIRPGIAVYGGASVPGVRNPTRTAVTIEARIAQIRQAKAGETVSYGATCRHERDTIIAACAVGYADGYPRSTSPGDGGTGTGCSGWIMGRRVPVLGRITMDLTMFDVTDCGTDAVKVGDMVELFGRNITVDEAARAAGTVSYEMLTRLGQRFHRIYLGMEET